MILRRLLALFTLAFITVACVFAEEGRVPDPNLAYQARRANPVAYYVDYSVMVTAPSQTKKLQVWLPLPQTDAGQELGDGELTTFPTKVAPRIGTEPIFGNKFAYFEFEHPQGAQVIRHRFALKVWELYWDIEPQKINRPPQWAAGFDRYLRGDRAVVLDDRFKKAAAEALAKRPSGPYDMAAIMAWVNESMTYDHADASLRASSEHALDKRRGHCSDYHAFCAALGRALGYPTRVTYGINTFPKSSPSHCKLEAYLPPYGWVSFDVSETQRLIEAIRKEPKLGDRERRELAAAAAARLFRGFRDNTWFLQTKGTDYELAPPASKRVPVVRTIYAEADGVALPDPDPANPEQREFAWMTAQRFTPDKAVSYPFKDWKSLLPKQ